MAEPKRPKVLIFDIGGVCVISPFRAIQDYEARHSIPRGYINYAISASKPSGSWHKLEKGQLLLNAAFFAMFRRDICNPVTWAKYHRDVRKSAQVPDPPEVDAEELYWTMMSTARETDPYMGPALRKLKEAGYRLVALSNTSVFPPGHEFHQVREGDVREMFEIFVSSAHVGMRKPERDIYEYTMGLVRERWPEARIGEEEGEVVFLDDIGENLRMGREMGWRTVKVGLERTDVAVKELEKITGLKLLEDRGKSAKL